MLLLLLIFLASLVRYTSAQVVGGVDISKLPICAQGCLENNTGAAAGCSITDLRCLCSSIPYINALSCCLESQCNATDQKAALAFDLALCASYNVSIPDFLGCSPLSSVSSSVTALSTVLFSSFPSTTPTTVSMPTDSTVTNIISAFTTTSGGPIATFTGQALLTGSCTVAQIASTSLIGESVVEYPWVGCSPELPNCCPYIFNNEGPLTICPTDYFTTSGTCCPSGWSLLPTPLLPGLTPCYTTPALALVPPTVTSGGGSSAMASFTTATAISTQLFTLSYTLTSAPSRGLSSGAIAGIAVGSAAFAVLLLALLFFLRRTRARRQARSLRDATIIRRNNERVSTMGFSPTTPHTSPPQSPGKSLHGGFSIGGPSPTQAGGEVIPELPSPGTRPESTWIGSGAPSIMSPVGSQIGSPMGPSRVGSPESQQSRQLAPVMELPGSTYLHEHHPLYMARGDGGGG